MKDRLSSSSLKQILGGRSIYLIGMMGSGKSVTGPILAKELDYIFVDSDVVVEKSAKKSIHQIFQDDGEKQFRDLETQVLKEIAKHYSLVVSTGGGVVTRSENWGVLHQGIIVWIDPGRDRLLERLKIDLSNRPLLDEIDPIARFDSLYEERLILYKEADLQISVEDESPEEVVLEIIKTLPSILINSRDQGEQQTIG